MPPINNEFGATQSFADPAVGGFVITPSNTGTLKYATRAIYVGTGGDVTIMFADGSGPITHKAVPQGTRLDVQANQVMATGTTASDLVGWY